MRNIIFLGAIAAMTACGYSEDSYADDASAEGCRILVLCEVFADEATCASEMEDAEVDESCTFDSSAAKDCIDALKEITECPTDGFPSSCDNVYTGCTEDSDSGM